MKVYVEKIVHSAANRKTAFHLKLPLFFLYSI